MISIFHFLRKWIKNSWFWVLTTSYYRAGRATSMMKMNQLQAPPLHNISLCAILFNEGWRGCCENLNIFPFIFLILPLAQDQHLLFLC